MDVRKTTNLKKGLDGKKISASTHPSFSAISLNEHYCKKMIEQGVWSPTCPVSLDRLKLLTLGYKDFDGVAYYDGQMMVLDAVASPVIEIFKTLFEHSFPIQKIQLIDTYIEYGPELADEKSMEDNNTVCFQNRLVAGTDKLSIHAYGLAVDVNPHQNGYITFSESDKGTKVNIQPQQSIDYLNRRNIRPGMVESQLTPWKIDTVVDLFNKYGFTVWGGDWNDPIDWHHFQVPRSVSEELAQLDAAKAEKYFQKLI